MSLIYMYPRRTAAGPAGDPYWASVSSLLHFDGADASSTIVDEKGLSITNSGPLLLTTSQYMFGGSSLNCNGGGYLVTPGIALGDTWTYEGWYRPTGGLYLCNIGGTGGQRLSVFMEAGSIAMYDGNYRYGSLSVPNNSWYHVAIVKTPTAFRMFINGAVHMNYADARNFNTANSIIIGADPGGGQRFLGQIDDIRITPGVARYTSAFTVPSAAFPNS